jgi:CheY-like chemotaxis protein
MKKILLVDDDYTTLSLFSILLEKEGYTCTCCSCCNSALNSIPQKDFALVISDVKMPGNDGLHLLKQVKRDYRDIKVMMMSAENIKPDELFQLGAIDFFNKLDGNNRLLEKIRAIEQDKRVSRRFSVRFPLAANNNPAQALNYSCDGILFESQGQFQESSLIEMALTTKADSLKVKGKVIRSQPLGAGCRTAVYFRDNIGPFLHRNYKNLSK